MKEMDEFDFRKIDELAGELKEGLFPALLLAASKEKTMCVIVEPNEDKDPDTWIKAISAFPVSNEMYERAKEEGWSIIKIEKVSL